MRRYSYVSREQLSSSSVPAAYDGVRRQTEGLATPLTEEDCSAQSMPDASPVKWHLAHTTWFFETFVLEPHLPGYRALNPAFRTLFNSYYNGIGPQFARAQRGMLTRPTLTEVIAYRKHVDAAMQALLDSDQVTGATLDLVELGLNHEQQHQELILTDVKHLFSANPLNPAYAKRWPLTSVRSTPSKWIAVDSGLSVVGHRTATFHFDNEAPAHEVRINAFEVADRLVTNGAYLEFMQDGGYQRPELWLSNGWALKTADAWHAPLYWRHRDGEWRCFTLHGECPIDRNAPVCHVSYYEADAFARWAECRLPTEHEWEVVAQPAPIDGNFLESRSFHPLALQHAPDATQPSQLYGDVWEWTRSDYAAYPGFRPEPSAVGEYNGKFMSGQYVLRGGSCATPAGHVRSTYRNFFPPGARWQFSGIRLARDIAPTGANTTRLRKERRDQRRGESVRFHSVHTADDAAARNEILHGLRTTPAQVSPKYFYDVLGSKLFDVITELPEYYQTRTEAAIFSTNIDDIANNVAKALGARYQMLDLGAGNCEKAASLLPALKPNSYVAIDVSARFLLRQANQLQRRFPHIPVSAVEMDFARAFALPNELTSDATLVFFPGSSIGNFEPDARSALLRQLRSAGRNVALLIGVDLRKDKQRLEAAYNDALGVTAAFNLNALSSVNGLIGSNFDPSQWQHVAFFDEPNSRIEMHLQARRDLDVTLPDGGRHFAEGERILTEHSYKWSLSSLRDELQAAEFATVGVWTDPQQAFAVALAVARNSG